jgi:hypothetical protein
MKENLKQTLDFGGLLNSAEIDQIAEVFELHKLKPGDHFIIQGKSSIELGFVDKGIMRLYFIQ